MLKRICTLGLLLATLCTYAQSYRLTWGEEMKLKKGTTDMDIIAADNSGIYLSEGHLRMKAYFVIGATYGEVQKLIKVDKNFNEVWGEGIPQGAKRLYLS